MYLSVIIPLHNGAKTIKRTIDSILLQNYTDMELIIVNDNSSDESLNIINSNSATYPFPVQIININPTVHCPGNTRQAGLSISKGEWVTFIDQDDEFLPNAFKSLTEVINTERVKSDKSIFNYLCCSLMEQYEDDNGITTLLDPTLNKYDTDSWLHGKFFNRVELLEKNNITFKEDMLYMEDVYFMKEVTAALYEMNVIQASIITTYCDKLTYRWHLTGENTHKQVFERSIKYDDMGYIKEYPKIMFDYYNRLLKVPNKSQDQRLMCIRGMAITMAMIFYKKQCLIDKYGYSCEAIKDLDGNTINNCETIFMTEIPDQEVLDFIITNLNKPSIQCSDVAYYFEDPLVWFANIKQGVINKWISEGRVSPKQAIGFTTYKLPLYILSEEEKLEGLDIR